VEQTGDIYDAVIMTDVILSFITTATGQWYTVKSTLGLEISRLAKVANKTSRVGIGQSVLKKLSHIGTNICQATTVTHTKRIDRNLLRKETSTLAPVSQTMNAVGVSSLVELSPCFLTWILKPKFDPSRRWKISVYERGTTPAQYIGGFAI